MTLRAVADNGDFLALDEIDVGIPIVIDAHGGDFSVLQDGGAVTIVVGVLGGEGRGVKENARPRPRIALGRLLCLL
jgi:hypothetical protein